ncbi:GNAT family N-acetyltransferase [Fredinandcohnia humi]
MIRYYVKEDVEKIVDLHYLLFKKEYGYDESFMDFIYQKVVEINKRNNDREMIWVVERNKKHLGSISISEYNQNTAQLGLFLLDPIVRGAGIGCQLIELAINHCRDKGFSRIILLTNDKLEAARSLYEKYGFVIIDTKKIYVSAQWINEECWELYLL